MIERQVETRFGTFCVEDTGGDRPPVVLLHGGASNLRAWDNVIPGLAGTHRCISFDLPGHGLTEIDILDFRRLQLAMIDAWGELKIVQPLLVGHSFGGLAAAFLGNQRGLVSGVVAIDPYLSDHEVRRDLPDLDAALGEIRSMIWPWPDTTDVDSEVERIAETAYSRRPDMANLRSMIKRGYRPLAEGQFRRYPRPEDEMKGVEANWSLNVLNTFKEVQCPLALVIASAIPGERLTNRRMLVREIMESTGRRDSSEFACPHDVPGYMPSELARYIAEWAGSLGS